MSVIAIETLKGVETKWVWATAPNQFGKLSLTVLPTHEQQRVLESHGLKLKKDKEGNLMYSFTQSPTKRDGSPNPMRIYDRFGSEFEGLVPNGAKMDIEFTVSEWNVSGRSGVKAYVRGAKVLGDVKPVSGSSLSFDTPADDTPF
jgi:hypothetical protein